MDIKDKIEVNYYPVIRDDETLASSDYSITNTADASANVSAQTKSVSENSNIVPSDNGSILNRNYLQSPNYSKGASGWKLDAEGNLEANDGNFRGDITGSSGSFSGSITASGGSIGGFTIGTDYIKDVADSFGLSSVVTGGNDVRFWSGDTFANRNTADLRIYEDGSIIATNIEATGSIFATSGWIGSATALVYDSQGINTGITGSIRGGMTNYDTGTGYFLGYSSGKYKFSIGDSTDDSKLLLWDGTDLIVNGSPIRNQSIFGDGSDGDVTISVDTTLTSDMYYNNLTVNSGKILNTGGYKVFVKNTLTNNGTIGRPGNAGGDGQNNGGVGGTAAASLADGTLSGSLGGKGGANGVSIGGGSNAGNPGTAGSNQTNGICNSGVVGGASNPAGSGLGSQPGGSAGVLTYSTSKLRNSFEAIIGRGGSSFALVTSSASSGSGASGGLNTSSGAGSGGGGGSGSPGGCGIISARKLLNYGTITFAGGKGGKGGNGDTRNNPGTAAGGSGGGGGSGGWIELFYSILVNSGTITVAGGLGGDGGLGMIHNAGGSDTLWPPYNGNKGADGLSGVLIQLQV